jgi:hypothetical protein
MCFGASHIQSYLVLQPSWLLKVEVFWRDKNWEVSQFCCMVYQVGLGTCPIPAWHSSPAVKQAQITLAGAPLRLMHHCGSQNMSQIFSLFHISYFSISLIFLSFFFLLLTFSHKNTQKSADIIPDSESTAKITPTNNPQHHHHLRGSEVMDKTTYSHATYTKLHNPQISIHDLRNTFYGENHSRKLHTEFPLHVRIKRYSQYKFQHPVLHQLHNPTSNPS